MSDGDNKQPLWATALALLSVAGFIAFALWLYRAVTAAQSDAGESAVAEVAFPPIDFAPLVEGWAEERASLLPMDPELEQMLLRLTEANTAHALASLELLDGEPSSASAGFEAALDAYTLEHGAPGARAAGWYAYAAFEQALRELVLAAHERGVTLEEVLRDPTDDVALRAYQGCGDFLLWAKEQGLVSDSVDPEVARAPVLVLLYHFRWARLASGKAPVETTLPAVDYEAVLRWRIQHARVELATRLRYIDAYGRMFGFTHYPEAFAQGMAHWMADDAEAARPLFREAWSSAPENTFVAAAYRASGAADQSN